MMIMVVVSGYDMLISRFGIIDTFMLRLNDGQVWNRPERTARDQRVGEGKGGGKKKRCDTVSFGVTADDAWLQGERCYNYTFMEWNTREKQWRTEGLMARKKIPPDATAQEHRCIMVHPQFRVTSVYTF